MPPSHEKPFSSPVPLFLFKTSNTGNENDKRSPRDWLFTSCFILKCKIEGWYATSRLGLSHNRSNHSHRDWLTLCPLVIFRGYSLLLWCVSHRKKDQILETALLSLARGLRKVPDQGWAPDAAWKESEVLGTFHWKMKPETILHLIFLICFQLFGQGGCINSL